MERNEGNIPQNPDLQPQAILLAASHHDVESLRSLLRTGSASVQDPDTKRTPLHAAIAACGSTSSTASRAGHTVNRDGERTHFRSKVGTDHELLNEKAGGGGETKIESENGNECGRNRTERRGGDGNEEEARVEGAAKTMRLLLQNGAIWNDTDANNETPGCLARRLGLKELYEIMVDAGVRAEMLLNRLDEYDRLNDEEDEMEKDEVEGLVEIENNPNSNPDDLQPAKAPLEDPKADENPQEPTPTTNPNNTTYLQSPLLIEQTRILDSSQNSVMMAWETKIMRRTATLLAPGPSLRILNIGHGMGIIDRFFQETQPSTHHIIEAHPSILAHMEQDHWHHKPNLTIHAGKWQDIVPALTSQGILFDVIYFDTFAEDYNALRDFFSDFVIGLLDEGGRWGFFNGLGADRQVCYDVYGKVVEMDLFEAGFDTEWETLEVGELDEEGWEGVRRRYWMLDEYRLPICRFIE